MMGWWGGETCGCCPSSDVCDECTTGTSPTTVTVALGSWSNVNCNACTSFTGNKVLTRGSTGTVCSYGANGSLGCTDADVVSSTWAVDAYVGTGTNIGLGFGGYGSNVIWGVRVVTTVNYTLGFKQTTSLYAWDSSGTSAINCSTGRTVTQFSETSGGSPSAGYCCTGPSTMSITTA